MRFTDEICARHLAEMVRYQTISHVDPGQMDFAEFSRFHSYLEETYPLVHQTLQREIVGHAGLLYTWKAVSYTHLTLPTNREV